MIGRFQWIIAIEKIVTIVLSTNHIPKAWSRQTVEWIHFVLKSNLIALNFFQVIYDPNIGLDLIIFFGKKCPFFLSGLLSFLLMLWDFLFALGFAIDFGSSATSWTAHSSLFVFIGILEAFVFWFVFRKIVFLLLMREGILKARLTHWIIKIIYEIKNKYYEGFPIHHFDLTTSLLKLISVLKFHSLSFFFLFPCPSSSIWIHNNDESSLKSIGKF